MTILRRGNIIRPSYSAGPYVITDVGDPCIKTDCVESGEEHFHITCQAPGHPEQGSYWLNGYRSDGTNVWSDDRLHLVDSAAQMELFA